MDVIKEGNSLERLVYRKAVAKQTTLSRKAFVKVETLHGQVEEAVTTKLKNRSKIVCFKSLHYTVVEGTGKVMLTLLKRAEGSIQFRVITHDDTAMSGKDYHMTNELVTMKAMEKEREISISIVDDENWEPDKDFFVELYSADATSRIKGEDTSTTVTIIDNDNPGTLGFICRNMIVRPRDEICTVEIERADGSSGEVSAELYITANNEALGGRPAKKGIDWKDLEVPKITFKTGETRQSVHILMPSTSVKEEML